MFSLVQKMLDKHNAKSEYWQRLQQYISDDSLDENEKQELATLAQELGLTDADLKYAHKKAASMTFKSIGSDSRITEDEKNALEDMIKHFGLELKDFNFNQKTFNKFYILAQVDNGVLPNIQNHDIDIIFKNDEALHWGAASALKKLRRVTQRVNYGGITTSVRIMKGVHYRAGSVRVQSVSQEVLATEDTGAFWITNQRIGFRGLRKNFAIPINKVAYFEVSPYGLIIAKEGREKPYIIQLEDYDVPAAILSYIVNNS